MWKYLPSDNSVWVQRCQLLYSCQILLWTNIERTGHMALWKSARMLLNGCSSDDISMFYVWNSRKRSAIISIYNPFTVASLWFWNNWSIHTSNTTWWRTWKASPNKTVVSFLFSQILPFHEPNTQLHSTRKDTVFYRVPLWWISSHSTAWPSSAVLLCFFSTALVFPCTDPDNVCVCLDCIIGKCPFVITGSNSLSRST